MRDVRKGDDGAIEEMFKYFTKIISKDNSEQKVGMDTVTYGVKKKYYVDLPRLDYLMYCMRGKRVFQPFGGIKAVDENDFEETEDLGLPLEYKDRMFQWVKEDGYRDFETTEQLVAGYKAPSWIDILVGTVDEDLLKEKEEEFKRDLAERKHFYFRPRGDAGYQNFEGWGPINTEAGLLPQAPQEPEPPKREREDLEAPPLFEPMGVTDRGLSGCRCVSAERHSKDIEIYLDL